jgi:hypothetical protein
VQGKEKATVPAHFKRTGEDVVCITTDRLGMGSEELGKIPMKAFLNTLWDYRPRPAKFLFNKRCVMLTADGYEFLGRLELLESGGVEIFSCGIRLGYYGIKETLKLKVDKITNM